MKKGDIVSIYQKPLTDEDFEGKAILLKRMNHGKAPYGFEFWEVKFISDNFIAIRLVKK